MNLYRLHLIAPAAARAECNSAATTILDDMAEHLNFSVPLSANGQAPATHYGCSIAVNEARRQAMLALMESGVGSGTKGFRVGLDSGLLEDAIGADASAHIGQPWGWADSLALAGLATVEAGT